MAAGARAIGTAGIGACPPEDSGPPERFMELLDQHSVYDFGARYTNSAMTRLRAMPAPGSARSPTYAIRPSRSEYISLLYFHETQA